MKPLPVDLHESLFVAEAKDNGISRTQLRGRSWQPVTYGLYAPAAIERSREAAYRMVSRILPDDAMAAHLTAARLLGLWLPTTPESLPTLASLPPGRERPERAGLYVFRSRAALSDRLVTAGLSVVRPAVCLGQLAEDLSLLDLIVAIDGALHARLTTRCEIEASIRRRQRGLPRLRQALMFCDDRSESPWETILRLLHVWSHIEVEPQHVIRSADGEPLARADLLISWDHEVVGVRRCSASRTPPTPTRPRA